MDERDWLAGQFEEHRTRLKAVAYRMLGSLSEADDAVQDAWLRLSRSDAEEIENLGAWLTTVVARVSLNMLRSRADQRLQPGQRHHPATRRRGAGLSAASFQAWRFAPSSPRNSTGSPVRTSRASPLATLPNSASASGPTSYGPTCGAMSPGRRAAVTV